MLTRQAFLLIIGVCSFFQTVNAQPIYEKYPLLDSSYRVYYRGEYELAGNIAFEALRNAEKSGQTEMQAEAYRLLGEINRASNNKVYALRYLDQAEELFSKIGNDYGVASAKNRKAAVYMEGDDDATMKKYLFSSLKISRDKGYKEIEFNNLTLLGGYYSWDKKDYEASFKVLKEAIQVAQEIGAYQDFPYVYLNICNSFRMNGQPDSALYYANLSLKYAREYSVRSYISRAYGQLSLLYGEYTKDYQKAWEAERLYTLYRDTLYDESRDKEIAELVEAYKTEIQEKELNKKDSFIQMAILGLTILVVFILVLFILYSRLQRRRKELEESKRDLESLNAMKDRLLSVLSHDLRSPVATLQNVFELLDFQELSQQELEKIFSEMQVRVYQTGQLLDNLLVWIRSQVKEIEPQRELVDIKMIVAENIELVHHLTDSKGLKVHLHAESSIMVETDKEMFKLIIRNLLNNAIKFSNEHEVIDISVEEDGSGYCKVRIKDHGVGMSKEVKERLFDLNMVSRKGTNEEVGVGIGLTLVKEFADALGIGLDVESEPGKGSVFTLHCKKS